MNLVGYIPGLLHQIGGMLLAVRIIGALLNAAFEEKSFKLNLFLPLYLKQI